MDIKILVPIVANLDNYTFFFFFTKNILLNGLTELFITNE